MPGMVPVNTILSQQEMTPLILRLYRSIKFCIVQILRVNVFKLKDCRRNIEQRKEKLEFIGSGYAGLGI
jgi:hypothetical protein